MISPKAGSAAAPAGALLTPEQLGELYQVSGRTIRDWFNAGTIPAEVAVGRVYRFDPARVAAALRAAAADAQRFQTPRHVRAI